MMDASEQARLAMFYSRMYQINAEVEAMKAANTMAAHQMLPPQYVHADFERCRIELWHVENDLRSLFG